MRKTSLLMALVLILVVACTHQQSQAPLPTSTPVPLPVPPGNWVAEVVSSMDDNNVVSADYSVVASSDGESRHYVVYKGNPNLHSVYANLMVKVENGQVRVVLGLSDLAVLQYQSGFVKVTQVGGPTLYIDPTSEKYTVMSNCSAAC